jgi:hypothetical protein
MWKGRVDFEIFKNLQKFGLNGSEIAQNSSVWDRLEA